MSDRLFTLSSADISAAMIMHNCSWWSRYARCSSQGVAQSTPPDPKLHLFGMHVRSLREARGLSLEELAERSGMSFRGVIYIEHGRRNPSLLTLLSIASGLGVAPARLLDCFSLDESIAESEADP
ncbi:MULTISPECIES: helix-turn-helix domain-containing protein [Streptomyces griseus group]|uniref:helix-turn-helix domain-containing protein n=1 Tax=Streptomyces griseus group TaxID=629295 RepID=UPI0036612E22